MLHEYAKACEDDPGYHQDICYYLEVDDRFMIRGRRQGSRGFEYRVQWITDECETIAQVWVPGKHLVAHQILLDEIDAREAGKPKRRPPPDGRYRKENRVSASALRGLEYDLQLHGYQEDREVYTDSDEGYADRSE